MSYFDGKEYSFYFLSCLHSVDSVKRKIDDHFLKTLESGLLEGRLSILNFEFAPEYGRTSSELIYSPNRPQSLLSGLHVFWFLFQQGLYPFLNYGKLSLPPCMSFKQLLFKIFVFIWLVHLILQFRDSSFYRLFFFFCYYPHGAFLISSFAVFYIFCWWFRILDTHIHLFLLFYSFAENFVDLAAGALDWYLIHQTRAFLWLLLVRHLSSIGFIVNPF